MLHYLWFLPAVVGYIVLTVKAIHGTRNDEDIWFVVWVAITISAIWACLVIGFYQIAN